MAAMPIDQYRSATARKTASVEFLKCLGQRNSHSGSSGSVALVAQIGNTAFDMDEKNQVERPQRYVWPWFVLGAFVLAIVLAILWMSVLVHRVREQREYNLYPAPKQPAPIQSTPTQSVSTQAMPRAAMPRTNSVAPSRY
jgi:hypothetical protein